jgi:hypothetical protein
VINVLRRRRGVNMKKREKKINNVQSLASWNSTGETHISPQKEGKKTRSVPTHLACSRQLRWCGN